MAKNVITTIVVNFMSNPMEKATQIHLNCRILAATLDFTSSFPMAFFAATKFFYSWAVLN